MSFETLKASESPSVKTAIPQIVRWRSRLFAIGGLLIFLILVIGFALSLGSANISFFTVWKILLNQLPFERIVAKPEQIIEQHDETQYIVEVHRRPEGAKPTHQIGKSQLQPCEHQEDDGKGMEPMPYSYHQRM